MHPSATNLLVLAALLGRPAGGLSLFGSAGGNGNDDSHSPGGGDDFSFLRVPAVEFVAAGGVGPGGEYFGQTAVREADGARVPHGIGSYLDAASGAVLYSGRWFNGRMEGAGNRYFSGGANYSGHLSANQLHGPGRMDWPNGTVFRGEFVHNRIVGRGEMTYPGGDVRQGVVGMIILN